jgi:hypothetical protein
MRCCRTLSQFRHLSKHRVGSKVLLLSQGSHGQLDLWFCRDASGLRVHDERVSQGIVWADPLHGIKLQTLLQQIDKCVQLLHFSRRHMLRIRCKSRFEVSAGRRFDEAHLLHRGVASNLVAFLRDEDVLGVATDEVVVSKLRIFNHTLRELATTFLHNTKHLVVVTASKENTSSVELKQSTAN